MFSMVWILDFTLCSGLDGYAQCHNHLFNGACFWSMEDDPPSSFKMDYVYVVGIAAENALGHRFSGWHDIVTVTSGNGEICLEFPFVWSWFNF